MSPERKKRILRRIEARSATPDPEPKSRLEAETEIFVLVVIGGDGNRLAAYARLREMTPKERHDLRRSVERIDGLLDEVALDLHFERSASKPNNE
jgi:hypothetical protein